MENARATSLPMREKEQRHKIDDVTYILNLSSASPAFEMMLALGPMLEDLSVAMDKGGDVRELPIGKVLARLRSPEFTELRSFLISHVVCVRDGLKPYRFEDQYEQHLEAYPSHYIAILWRSFVFQFARFFRGGGGASLLPKKLRDLLSRQDETSDSPTA